MSSEGNELSSLRGSERSEACEDETPKLSGPWSSWKNEILDRCARARAEAGVKLADIVAASGGALSDGELLALLTRHRLPTKKWEALSSALAALGWPGPEDPPQERGGVNE